MSSLRGDGAADIAQILDVLRADLGDAEFLARADVHLPTLHPPLRQLYGARDDGLERLRRSSSEAAASWTARPLELKARDDLREADPDWFLSNRMLGGVCYVDRYAGTLAGRPRQHPVLRGARPDLPAPHAAVREPGGQLRRRLRGVELPAGEPGARHDGRARARSRPTCGWPASRSSSTSSSTTPATSTSGPARPSPASRSYEDFYLIFPDRTMPDAYEQTVREIFPDDHPGSFVQLPDGRWIWATFYHFQWDLNYANPAVFRAMAGEMLFLANQGVEILRMDAVAFIWKRLGTPCESLPEAHLLLRAFNAVLRMAAPSLLFKSEAIVHPDEVIEYISLEECQLSYNPLQMALTWEALATRDPRMLQQALERRHALPAGTAWVNYVRSHDDIGWTFADEDAAELGIDGYLAPPLPQRLLRRPVPGHASPAACRSRRTRRPATRGSPARRRRSRASRPATRAASTACCSPTRSRCRRAACRCCTSATRSRSSTTTRTRTTPTRRATAAGCTGRDARRALRAADGSRDAGGPRLRAADRADPRRGSDARVRGRGADRLRCAASVGAGFQRPGADRRQSWCSPTSATTPFA